MRRKVLSLILLSVLLGASSFRSIDKLVRRTLERWKVPGIAVAVIKEGKLAFAKGYGYRDLERKLPVTSRTLFAIGSCTKAFTATALGILVDEGRVEWDRPVIDYLPDFRLKDEYATMHVTVRDLLLHRTGLPRHDLVWYGASLSRQQLYHRLRFLTPSAELRQLWQYQNLMYMTAGYLIEKITGQSWESFVRNRILEPLEMHETNFSVEVSKRADDAALPYAEVKGKLKRIPFRNIDAMGPAGSINSNLEEMAHWVLLQLNKGTYKGRRIISAETLSEIHRPQMVVPRPRKYKELFYLNYAMGWMVTSYRGHLLLMHGGSIDGFKAAVSFMPDDGLGLIVFANKSGTPVPQLLTYAIYDRLLGLKPAPWNERFWKERQQEKKLKEKLSLCRKGTSPSHPLKDYEGDYCHPAYGLIKIKVEQGKLVALFHDQRVTLRHCHYDVFETEKELLIGRLRISFLTNKAGVVDRLKAALEPRVEDIVFKRRMVTKEELSELAGFYQANGTKAEVKLKGNALFVILNGKSYSLLPLSSTEFKLAGLPSVLLKFERKQGKGVFLVISGPEGTYRLEKVR